jgi:integrase
MVEVAEDEDKWRRLRVRKLTALDVQRATEPGLYGDGENLYLQVSQSGTKSWLFRYRLNGKSRAMGLGSANAITLKRARELCVEPRRLCAEGIDPIDAKRAQRAAAAVDTAGAITFKNFAEDYIRLHQHSWRSDKHRQQWQASLSTDVFPVFGNVPVRDITTALVLKALQPIWTIKPEAASRTRGRIEVILNAAKAGGLRSGENPAQWRGHLEMLLPAPRKLRAARHFAALPYQELPALMQELRTRPSIGARALEFAILTAARSNEVNLARWAEIDLEQRVWVIPAERMKAHKEHRVPLSDAAVSILRQLYATRSSEFAFSFTGGKPVSGSTMRMLLRLAGHKDATVHGFRSSFRDWAAEQTSYASEVIEMALAHSINNKVEAAYRRTDLFEKRARLMAAWAEFCAQAPTSSVVVPIRK